MNTRPILAAALLALLTACGGGDPDPGQVDDTTNTRPADPYRPADDERKSPGPDYRVPRVQCGANPQLCI